MTRALGRWFAAMLPVATLLGCAVGTQQQPTAVDDADVPFGLVEPEPAAATTTVIIGVTVTIYLIDSDLLTAVSRIVPDGDPATVVEQLLEQPPPAETERGLRSALANDGEADLVQSVDINRGVATVDLSSEFSDLDSRSQVLAIAQLVYTLTGRPGTGQVAFSIEGAPVEVPRADGTLTSDPLTRGDFPDFVHRT